MPELFTTLLKINVVLLLFATAYYLVLRRLTFYTINRLFLVLGIIFSTIYPFINLTDLFHQQQLNQEVIALVPQLNQKVSDLVPSTFISGHWKLLSIVFYVGASVMALRLFAQFLSLYLMHKKSKPGAVADFPVRILQEPVGPFSFWQTVYINPALHQAQELKTIVAHENIHVKQWHSLDIILAELSVVFYWFNPGVWLMKRAVKENLEFITDQKILSNGIDRKAYQYSLLDVGNLTPPVAIVNNFNLSDLKKRIKMMNVKRSSRLTLSRYLLVTPVLLLVTLAFTIDKKEIKINFQPIAEVLSGNYFNKIETLAIVPVKKSTEKKKRLKIAPNEKVDTAGAFRQLINQLFITRDTVQIDRQTLDRTIDPLLTQIALKRSANGDTAVSSAKVVIRGFKLTDEQQAALGVKADQVPKDPNEKSNIQTVTIKGYGIKSASNLTSRVAGQFIPGMISFKAKDSVKVKNIVLYLDDKKAKKEELDQFDPAQIKSVDVITRKEGNEIIVIGRKKDQ